MRKKERGYSLPSNLAYAYRNLWKDFRAAAVACIVAVFARVLQPFVGILMPKVLLDQLASGSNPGQFALVIGSLALAMLLVNAIKNATNGTVDENIAMFSCFSYGILRDEKLMDVDYELLEDPAARAIMDKGKLAVKSNHTPGMHILHRTVNLLANLLGFTLYGGVVASVHPLILVLLTASASVNFLALRAARNYEERTKDERAKHQNRSGYMRDAMRDAASAKDIRLYSMVDWLLDIGRTVIADYERSEGRVQTRYLLAKLADCALILLRDGLSYAYLIYLMLNNRIALGDFVMVFAAIGSFATWVSDIMNESSELMRSSRDVSDLRAFLALPDRSNRGRGAQVPTRSPGIELRGVRYTYPGAETPALRELNVSIRPGERIAIVGRNGAGKTTLVKLLCGLYHPTEGCILVDGVDSGAYNRDEYFTLFSPVFQDIHLMTTTIACNVSQQPPDRTDRERVWKCLERAGLAERVNALERGIDTPLVKQVNEDATEFSGGELQKLALARALYKDAPVIILDEPTAALDPIAESQVYEQYASLTKGKTSVYISHRLASTRFCDRILLIEDGRIAEVGTHEELVALGGGYAQMFGIQSSYYGDDEVKKDA